MGKVSNKGNLKNTEATQWKPGQSGNPKGRPKKILTKYKDAGYSKTQVRDTFSAISGLTEKEVGQVLKDPESTILEKTIAQTYTNAKKKGDYSAIRSIIELFADRATNHVEHNMNAKIKTIESEMTDEQLDAEIKRLKKEGY